MRRDGMLMLNVMEGARLKNENLAALRRVRLPSKETIYLSCFQRTVFFFLFQGNTAPIFIACKLDRDGGNYRSLTASDDSRQAESR